MVNDRLVCHLVTPLERVANLLWLSWLFGVFAVIWYFVSLRLSPSESNKPKMEPAKA